MQITYELQLTDWKASDRFFALRHKAQRKETKGGWFLWGFLGLIIASFFLPVVLAPLRYLETSEFKAAWEATGVLALWPMGIALIPLSALALLWLCAPLLQRQAFRDSPFYGKQFTLSIEEEGIGGDTFIPWMLLEEVEETPSHIFLLLSDNSVFIVPKRAFESDFAATRFAARCRDGRQKV